MTDILTRMAEVMFFLSKGPEEGVSELEHLKMKLEASEILEDASKFILTEIDRLNSTAGLMDKDAREVKIEAENSLKAATKEIVHIKKLISELEK